MEMQTNDFNTKLSAIDKALAQAKSRKTAKEDPTPMGDTAKKKLPKVKATSEDNVANKLAKDAVREARKLQLVMSRDARRQAKALERAQAKTPHMKKIEKAANALPEMTSQLETLFSDVTTNFSAAEITTLALHLQHFNRVKATERALGLTIKAGMSVRIIAGPNKYIGMKAVVTKSQRIRCFVEIPGVKKQVYLFTSDVEHVNEVQQATGTEG